MRGTGQTDRTGKEMEIRQSKRTERRPKAVLQRKGRNPIPKNSVKVLKV